MLCSFCSSIPLRFHELCDRWTTADFSDSDPRIPHQPGLLALQDSARKGCELCQLFGSVLITNYGGSETTEHFAISIIASTVGRQKWRLRELQIQNRKWLGKVTFCTGNDETAARDEGMISERIVSHYPVSDVAMNLVNEWILDCHSKHNCQNTVPTILPTRVIDLGDDDKLQPRLLVTNGARGLYTALSHVWGEKQPLQTTISSFETNCNCIPFGLFPNLFRDAVMVTKRLGIRYLWIDSICIIQDSTEDWQTECAKMSEVYQNSYITIAAPDSIDCEHGFLHPRSVPGGLPIRLPYYSRIGEISGTMSVQPIVASLELSDSDTSILRTRAWVLQEQLLSPRTLYFGREQTYWECFQEEHHERHGMRDTKKYQINLKAHLLLPSSQAKDTIMTWNLIVKNYSSRQLTYPGDKLPALSGLAKDFYRRSGYTYLAGLWKEYLIQGLCWKAITLQCNYQSKKSTAYRAPSWSWASIDAPVSFETRFENLVTMSGTSKADASSFGAQTKSGIGGSNYGIEASLLASKIELSGNDAFGSVESAVIRIRGRVKRAEARYTLDADERARTEENKATIKNHWYLFDPISGYRLGFCHFDCQSMVPGKAGEQVVLPPRQIQCLRLAFLAAGNSLTYRSSAVLLLENTGNESLLQYRRVGYAKVSMREFKDNPPTTRQEAKKDWFKGSKMTEITLI